MIFNPPIPHPACQRAVVEPATPPPPSWCISTMVTVHLGDCACFWVGRFWPQTATKHCLAKDCLRPQMEQLLAACPKWWWSVKALGTAIGKQWPEREMRTTCTACCTTCAMHASFEYLFYAFYGRFSGWQGRGGFTYNNGGLHNGGGLPLAVQNFLQENATTVRTARIGRYIHSETAGCAPQHAPSNALFAFGNAAPYDK